MWRSGVAVGRQMEDDLADGDDHVDAPHEAHVAALSAFWNADRKSFRLFAGTKSRATCTNCDISASTCAGGRCESTTAIVSSASRTIPITCLLSCKVNGPSPNTISAAWLRAARTISPGFTGPARTRTPRTADGGVCVLIFGVIRPTIFDRVAVGFFFFMDVTGFFFFAGAMGFFLTGFAFNDAAARLSFPASAFRAETGTAALPAARAAAHFFAH